MILWNIVKIGEAAARITHKWNEEHPNIDFKGPIAMRHKVAHGYDVLDLSFVYSIAKTKIPELRTSILATFE
jgi:uncharacterized protein with HEPN domain